MKNEGWGPLRRQKKPLLTAKQRAARLKFAKRYKNLTAEEWDDFLFSAAQSKIRYCLGFSGEQSSSSISGLKKFKMDHMGRNDRPQSHWDTSFTPRTDFDCRLPHQQHIRSLSFTV